MPRPLLLSNMMLVKGWHDSRRSVKNTNIYSSYLVPQVTLPEHPLVMDRKNTLINKTLDTKAYRVVHCSYNSGASVCMSLSVVWSRACRCGVLVPCCAGVSRGAESILMWIWSEVASQSCIFFPNRAVESTINDFLVGYRRTSAQRCMGKIIYIIPLKVLHSCILKLIIN